MPTTTVDPVPASTAEVFSPTTRVVPEHILITHPTRFGGAWSPAPRLMRLEEHAIAYSAVETLDLGVGRSSRLWFASTEGRLRRRLREARRSAFAMQDPEAINGLVFDARDESDGNVAHF